MRWALMSTFFVQLVSDDGWRVGVLLLGVAVGVACGVLEELR